MGCSARLEISFELKPVTEGIRKFALDTLLYFFFFFFSHDLIMIEISFNNWHVQQRQFYTLFMLVWAKVPSLYYTSTAITRIKYFNLNKLCIHPRAVLATRDAHIIAIFPAGNDIDLKHRLTIIIFNIFFKF